MKKLLLAVAAATLGLAAAPSAMAQTNPDAPPNGRGSASSRAECDASATSCEDADMDVRMVIVGKCSAIEVGDIDFGSHPMLAGTTTTNFDQQTTLDVFCMTGQAYTITLDRGLHPTGTQRRVVNESTAPAEGTDFINYKLYSDMGRTTEWGDGTQGAGAGVTGTGTSAYEQRIVYGRITQTGANPPGTYTDLVTATLTFN